MFVVQALYSFQPDILKQQKKQQQPNQSHYENNPNNPSQQQQAQKQIIQKDQAHLQANNQANQQNNLQNDNQGECGSQHNQSQNNQQNTAVSYLSFQKGDKILVLQSYQNGWWYGHTIKQPQLNGFFPSNYVQVTTKPKPPPPPPQPLPQQQQANQVFDPNQYKGIDWVQNQLKNIQQGPVKSDYYLGIKSYKNVKIDQKNQNILKGDHVKFDVSTGLAKVPVKDQAPAAKAVRQMGYYFDYHQWVQQRNKHPGQKSRPDPKKKKIKKLNLKGMK